MFLIQTEKNEEIKYLIKETIAQIDDYLLEKRKTFDLLFQIEGTEFQMNVLTQMTRIPYDKKLSNTKLAKEAGFEGASRAVGTVCKVNLLPLIVLCRRVKKRMVQWDNI